MTRITQELRNRHLSRYSPDERRTLDNSLTNAITAFLDPPIETFLPSDGAFLNFPELSLVIQPNIYYRVFGYFAMIVRDKTKNIKLRFSLPGVPFPFSSVKGVANFYQVPIFGNPVREVNAAPIFDSFDVVDGGDTLVWDCITVDLTVGSINDPFTLTPFFAQHAAGTPSTSILAESNMIAFPLIPITNY